MGVIWYAIGIYIVGVAVILFVRPKGMFRPGGTWKEFGLSTEGNYTVFPFWMFSLVWAVVSFAIANMFQIFFASTAIQSLTSFGDVTPNSNISNIIQPISAVAQNAGPVALPQVVTNTSIPTLAAPPTNTRLPGYYVLESALRGLSEQPRYVYWGPEPPSVANLK
jgi:hypothetical protein